MIAALESKNRPPSDIFEVQEESRGKSPESATRLSGEGKRVAQALQRKTEAINFLKGRITEQAHDGRAVERIGFPASIQIELLTRGVRRDQDATPF